MLSIHLRLGRSSGLFPAGFPINNLYTFLFSPNRVTCPAHLIFLDLIIHMILGEVYNHAAPRYAVFSTPINSSLQISTSAPYSQIPSVYVPPLMSKTMFHIRIEPQAKLQYCIF
jgi:hypothetical protein